jgi:hypothetical protein
MDATYWHLPDQHPMKVLLCIPFCVERCYDSADRDRCIERKNMRGKTIFF